MVITFPLYIIGMPGSGKSTISKSLSHRLKMSLIDTDHFIETQEGVTIKDMFENKGEAYFRNLETQTLQTLKDFKGIISTGGGIVLNPLHCDIMKLGYVIYIDTSLKLLKERLSKDNQRPQTIINHVDKLYEQRDTLYRSCAHLIVSNNASMDETIETIMKHLEASYGNTHYTWT
jgi:shikimate kinase